MNFNNKLYQRISIKSRQILSTMLVLALVLQIQFQTILAATPDFVLENVTISNPSIEKGTTFTVAFTIKNTSGGQLKNIYLDTTSTSFSRVGTGANSFVASTIESGNATGISLNLVCNDTTSNRIPITLNYQTAGDVARTTNEQVLVTFATPTVTKDVATSTYKPSFIISAGDLGNIEAGATAKMTISLKNTSNFIANKVVITPQLPESLSGKVSLNSGNLLPKNVTINNGAEQTFDWSMTVLDLSLVGTYPITYSIDYMNSYNDAFTTTVSGYIKVTPNKEASGVVVTDKMMAPIVPIRESKMTLSFTMKNRTSASSDITLWVDGLPDSAFTFQGQSLKKKITLSAFNEYTVSFDYLVKKGALEGNYPYTLKYTYTDTQQNLITTQADYILNLAPITTLKGTLEIQNMTIPKSGVSSEKSFQVSFDLVNTGENDIESIDVNFTGSQEVWAQSQSIIQVKKLAKGERKTLTYSLMGSKQTESKNVPISFAVTYDSKAGEEIETKNFTVSNGVLILGTNEADPTAPKILVSSFATTPVDVSPGTTFDLGFTIRNTNLEKNIKNVKMTLSSVDAVTQKSNIIPIGQSESLFVATLGTDEEAIQTMKLMIPSDYTNTVCDIKVAFSFEDGKGVVYQDQETIHIPMIEKIELTGSDVRIGKVLTDSYSLELDFYNTGKAMLQNLMVDLEGDFESTNSNYFVGDLQTGKMDIYSVNITGEIPATIKGSVVFTYEDHNGQKIEKKVPFDLTYVKPAPTAEETAALEMENLKAQTPKMSPLAIVIPLGVVGVIAFFITRARKRKAA